MRHNFRIRYNVNVFPDLALTPEMENTETDKKPERIDPDDPYDPSVDISEDMVDSPKEDKLTGPES